MTEPQRITAATRLITLLGDPVAHSLSPRLHNAALRALNLDAVYVALRCSSADCGPLLLAVARAGGAGNVTIPHKQIAAAVLELPSAAVQRTGACNTFWFDNGRIAGDNTDVQGFRQALRNFRGDVAGACVLLLGAGGAALAVLAALADENVERVDVVARNRDRFTQLSALAAGAGLALNLAERISGRADLIINATPLGLHDDDPVPFPLDQIADGTAVFDLVYHPGETAWVRAARARGLPAIDGKEMLLHQAALSFAHWWSRDAPIDEMRRALAR